MSNPADPRSADFTPNVSPDLSRASAESDALLKNPPYQAMRRHLPDSFGYRGRAGAAR
jgi:hypothetical protein